MIRHHAEDTDSYTKLLAVIYYWSDRFISYNLFYVAFSDLIGIYQTDKTSEIDVKIDQGS